MAIGSTSDFAASDRAGARRVLIGEADLQVALIAERVLARSGWRTLVAATPEQFAALVETMLESDVIISCTRWSLLPEVRAALSTSTFRGVRIVITGAFDDATDLLSESRPFSYVALSKPYSTSALQHAVLSLHTPRTRK